MSWTLVATLFVTCYLMQVVTLGNGTAKRRAENLLTLVWLAILIAAFSTVSWKFGLLMIALSFMFGMITRPLAARSLRKLNSVDAAAVAPGAPLLPFADLDRISRDLAQPINVDAIVQEALSGARSASSNSRASAKDRLFSLCEQTPALNAVLERHGASRQELAHAYQVLRLQGAGQWVSGHFAAASALAYPHTLDWVLSRRSLMDRDSRALTAFAIVEHFRAGRPLESSISTPE